MRFLFWIIVLPLLFVAAFFAIANREPVTVDLWPVHGAVSIPLFVALVAFLYIGFVLGALVAWWACRRSRARARHAKRRADALQQEVDALKARIEAERPRPPLTAAATHPNALPKTVPTTWPSA